MTSSASTPGAAPGRPPAEDPGSNAGATRLAHDDLGSPHEMRADGREVGRRLERVGRAAARPAPSIHFADYPREVRKPEIRVSDAAARIAGALHLHLD